MSEASMADHLSPVEIDFTRLVDGSDLSREIAEGYGAHGLGLIIIKNVPKIATIRSKLLQSSFDVAHLPEEILAKYEDPKSYYSYGWSRGKEKMSNGKPDFSKGSWYARPFRSNQEAKEMRLKDNANETFYGDNIWPSDELPKMQEYFGSAANIIAEIGSKLAFHVDTYCNSKLDDYQDEGLEAMIKSSKHHTGRLLHYFPSDSQWCGWHNDHSALTGLIFGQFYNERGEIIPNPDPANVGLFCKTRSGDVVKVECSDPENSIGFQIGESMQIISGGVVMATPHMVQGAKGMGRASFALFMGPGPNYKLRVPDSRKLEEATAMRNLPPGVPLLEDRWGKARERRFVEFHDITIQSYY